MSTRQCFLEEPVANQIVANRQIVLSLTGEAKAWSGAIGGIFHGEVAQDRVREREIDVSVFTSGEAA